MGLSQWDVLQTFTNNKNEKGHSAYASMVWNLCCDWPVGVWWENSGYIYRKDYKRLLSEGVLQIDKIFVFKKKFLHLKICQRPEWSSGP